MTPEPKDAKVRRAAKDPEVTEVIEANAERRDAKETAGKSDARVPEDAEDHAVNPDLERRKSRRSCASLINCTRNYNGSEISKSI